MTTAVWENDPVQFGPQQLVSSTKLVRNLSTYLEKAKDKPIFVTREQEVEAVILNIDEYRQLLWEEEKAEQLYHAIKAVRKLAEHCKAEDKLLTTEDIIERLNLSEPAPVTGGE